MTSVEKRSALPLPRWKRGRDVQSMQQTDEQTDAADVAAVKDNGDTKFGAIKVHAPILGKRQDVKTFVVTNKTTTADLVTMVLTGYSAICEDNQLFYLTVENMSDNTEQKRRRLKETERPLDVQGNHPRDFRFTLQVSSEAGIITVRDKGIKAEAPSVGVFMTSSGTCELLLRLMLQVYKVRATADDYVIHEVDSASQLRHQLQLSDKPLTIQKQWLDPHECYFEIRAKADATKPDIKIRRSQSLEEITGHKKLLNIREIRKSLIPKRLPGRKSGIHGPNELTDAVNYDDNRSRDAGLNDDGTNEVHADFTKLQTSSPNCSETEPQAESPQPRTSTPNDTNRETNRSPDGGDTSRRGRTLVEGGKRRTRSLSREKSGVTSQRLGTAFGLHTQERARRRRRNSTQDVNGLDSSSASDIINGARKPRHERSTSLDNISAWERRKMYDNSRKNTADDSDKVSETSETSFPGKMEQSTKSGVKHRHSTHKSAVSSIIGKARSRRALPKIPNQGNNDSFEERKKRISEKVLEKAAQMRLSYEATQQNVISEAEGTNVSAPDSAIAPEFPMEGEHINIQSIEESAVRPASLVSEFGTISGNNEHISDMVFQPVHPATEVKAKTHAYSGTSQETLQKVIHDLKDAATKSYDILCSTKTYSTSSSYAMNGDITNTDYNKSVNSVAMETKVVNGIELPKPIAKSHVPSHSVITDITPSPSSDSLQNHDFCRVSLHRVMRSCDLHHVTLRVGGEFPGRHSGNGLTLDKVVFLDDRERARRIFTSPSGTKPLLGQKGSAFQPVESSSSSDAEQTPCLICVTSLDHDVLTEVEGHLVNGDYIIEVNGTSLLGSTLQDAVSLMAQFGSHLELVTARLKSHSPETQVQPHPDIQRELDKMTLKFNTIKQDSDDYMDQIAELKVELQSRDNKIHGLELDLSQYKQRLADAGSQSETREQRISEWKLETNSRSMEIARLKFETNQKDERIGQLKNLLIQQEEVMNLPNNNVEYFDYDYEGTHVSAV